MTDARELLVSAERALAEGELAYADDRLDVARVEWEQAFRGFRAAGQLLESARTAMALGELHWAGLGNLATGRGWLERARRLLEEVGPCVEWGYWELARMACDRPDIDDLAASAERALAIALENGDVGLEARALADCGVALVTQGRVQEGFGRLDEALASLTSGEVDDPRLVGGAFCALLTSCERTGEVERAAEIIRIVRDHVLEPTGGRPRVLGAHCQLALGGLYAAAGRWDEAEEALGPLVAGEVVAYAAKRAEAASYLAELRLQQGRVDEAALLLAPFEDHVSAAGPLARLHLQRGEPALAVAVLRGAVRQLVGDVLRGGPLLETLAEAELATGNTEGAADAARLLGSMATALGTPLLAALAALAEGRVARSEERDLDAIEALEGGLAVLSGATRPRLVAIIQLELADTHAHRGDVQSATACARSAHAAAQRVGDTPLSDRAAATLRSLGAVVPRRSDAAGALGDLTAREKEVLDGLRRGDTNSQIAASLYLSPKTVEHHVSRILSKLGVRTRAEAAAMAATSRPRPGTTESGDQ